MKGISRVFVLVLVLLVFVLSFTVSSCGPGQLLGPTLTPTSTPTSTPTRTPTPTPLPTIIPITDSNLRKFCTEGGFPFPSAAPYSPDNQTHHVKIVDPSNTYYPVQEDAVPKGWEASGNNTDLILCMSFLVRGQKICDCNYGGYTLTNFEGIWDLVLYSAKTGKILKSDRITARHEGCNSIISVPKGASSGTYIDSPLYPSDMADWFYKVGISSYNWNKWPNR